MTCGTFFEYADTPVFEESLDWQVGEAKTAELGRQLQKNRDRYKKQVSYLELQVTEGLMRKSEADRCRRNWVWLTVRRAKAVMKNEAWNARRDWARAKLASKGEGKEFDIPEVNVEERMDEIEKQQEEKLREIALG